MALEQQIEELRAEFSACVDAAERKQIEKELNYVKALLATREAMIEAQTA